MSEIEIGIGTPEGVALTVLTHLNDGKVDDAIAGFAEEFTYEDHGLRLEFKDKERLSEFFRKTRELYPDSFLEPDTVLVSGNHVTMKWTLQTTVMERIYGGLFRKVQVSVHGVSIIRTENGKTTDWADYYDGMTSRRTALAEHFNDWIEL